MPTYYRSVQCGHLYFDSFMLQTPQMVSGMISRSAVVAFFSGVRKDNLKATTRSEGKGGGCSEQSILEVAARLSGSSVLGIARYVLSLSFHHLPPEERSWL